MSPELIADSEAGRRMATLRLGLGLAIAQGFAQAREHGPLPA
jgi:hypothetical protein